MPGAGLEAQCGGDDVRHVEDLLEQLPAPAGHVPASASVALVQQGQAAHEADGDLLAEQQRELGLAGGDSAPGRAAAAFGDQALVEVVMCDAGDQFVLEGGADAAEQRQVQGCGIRAARPAPRIAAGERGPRAQRGFLDRVGELRPAGDRGEEGVGRAPVFADLVAQGREGPVHIRPGRRVRQVVERAAQLLAGVGVVERGPGVQRFLHPLGELSVGQPGAHIGQAHPGADLLPDQAEYVLDLVVIRR